jgi:hypothetical protein
MCDTARCYVGIFDLHAIFANCVALHNMITLTVITLHPFFRIKYDVDLYSRGSY